MGVSDRHCHRTVGLRSVVDVDRKDDIREFLISRRAKVSPEQAGIPSYGELRRVPGLRREEVAQLAGVSTDYYTRLERGSIRGVSDAVLEAVAAALQLDEAERAHLMDLARTANAAVAPGTAPAAAAAGPPRGAAPAGRHDRSGRHWCRTAVRTCWPQTCWAVRFTRPVFNSAGHRRGRMPRAGCRTRRATFSSTRARRLLPRLARDRGHHGRDAALGSGAKPPRPGPERAGRGADHAQRRCSPRCGPGTTCGSTPRGPSASTTRSPGICPCSSRRCTFPAMRAKPCSPSPRSPAPHPKTRWHSSPAGRHRRPKQPPPAIPPADPPSRTRAPTRSQEHSNPGKTEPSHD